jgi:tRNA-Thr(GGU) m(6)t(6)A37 methyltransferase TsaA
VSDQSVPTGESIQFKIIGLIRSPFKSPQNVPIQPAGAKGIKGRVILKKEYQAGLKDLAGFSHIILIYYFHLIQDFSLIVKPYMDKYPHGIFATRAPKRPNPIGLSIVRLLGIQDNILEIEDVDIVDNTPLLDIKPYVPEFDQREKIEIGWLTTKIHQLKKTKDDGRFIKKK